MKFLKVLIIPLLLMFSFLPRVKVAFAMPINSEVKDFSLLSKYVTNFKSSSNERKHNIYLAAEFLDKTFVDIGAEFSFNRTVGERTEKRGFKKAHVILNGEFTEGVGGGVCQVSTAVYNAVIRAGLKVTEYHAHSLQVSYVEPSFDAMVSFYGADLKFINDTNMPVYITTSCTENSLTVKVYGENSGKKYKIKSVTTAVIEPSAPIIIKDDKGEYPDLYVGETRILRYPKNGIKSEGYLVEYDSYGNYIKTVKLRSDTYLPISQTEVLGTAVREDPAA